MLCCVKGKKNISAEETKVWNLFVGGTKITSFRQMHTAFRDVICEERIFMNEISYLVEYISMAE